MESLLRRFIREALDADLADDIGEQLTNLSQSVAIATDKFENIAKLNVGEMTEDDLAVVNDFQSSAENMDTLIQNILSDLQKAKVIKPTA